MAAGLLFAGATAVKSAKESGQWDFDPLRLALRNVTPAWLEAPMARAFYASYERAAGEPFALHDLEALRAFADRVGRIPWVESIDARPVYPDRVFLDLELRRPRVCAAEGRYLRLLDGEGRTLPLLRADALLQVDVAQRFASAARAEADLPDQPFALPWVLGLAPVDTDRDAARAAALLATEWREEVYPLLQRFLDGGAPPRLLAVDCANHGLRLDRGASEYEFLVGSSDARPVRVAWGHAPGGAFKTRIPVAEKARVLALVLRKYDGLRGVVAFDVRYGSSWQGRVVVRD